MISRRISFADSNAALELALGRLTEDARNTCSETGMATVALDTEFIRTRTFYPIAALYQLASANEVVIIDPLPIDDWRPFTDLLESNEILKLMHSCSEDLEVFARHLDTRPGPLFDTQVAAAFLGSNFSPGYAELVRACTGVELGKHHTRSDWLARPLADEQIEYAIEDVTYLAEIHAKQRRDLERLGRIDWFQSELDERLVINGATDDTYYLGVRSAWRCEGKQINRLKALCAWREQRAKQRDLPRGHVISDEELVDLAVLRDVAPAKVRECVAPAAARRYTDDLLSIMADADELEEVATAPPRPLSRAQTKVVKRLKTVGANKASELDLAPELLSRRRDLEGCVRSFQETGDLSPAFLGWRYPLVGEEFASILAESMQTDPDAGA